MSSNFSLLFGPRYLMHLCCIYNKNIIVYTHSESEFNVELVENTNELLKGLKVMKSKKIDSSEELNIAFQIREEVFVKEQGVPLEDEFDEFDSLHGQCEHILVYFNEMPAGTGRIIIRDGIGKLDRISILKPYRQFGLGKLIVSSLEEIAKNKELSKVKLHGQTHAEGFYHKLGYQTSSDIFMEDGIPHYLMVKDLFDK
ncbi:putative N-acetyltransferase YjcF [compost metagenome]